MSLDRARWQQLSTLLDEAMALPPSARPGWMAALRTRDASLADELAPLLATAADGESTTPSPDLAGFAEHLGRVLHDLGAEASPATIAPGARLGPWQLLRQIGEGGMGQVWLAQRVDGMYDAQAAIKLLRPELLSEHLQARFARERAVLARLNHPAVARLLDAGVEQGQAYLVLEYVDGVGLSEYARRACPTLAQRVRLLLRIAEAVDHAHTQLIVHRDLKPSNVLVTPDGTPKLLDFGIAGLLGDDEPVDDRLTRQTGRGLTLGYAAPEQITGAPVGVGADVFALGVMLYELCSGELPFSPRSADPEASAPASRQAIEHAVLHDEPERLSVLARKQAPSTRAGHPGPGRPDDAGRVAGDLEAIAAKALRKDPAGRYGSVRLLIEELTAWLEHRPVRARRDDWRHRTRLWLRRHAVLSGAMAAVVLSLSAGLAAATWQWRRAEASARQSDQVTTYLTELLASASPQRHGGEWPTVLKLLDTSRATLGEQFRDDPDTRLRLLQVLADTYHALNRFDVALPLREEQIALSTQRQGADDPRTLRARMEQARSWQVMGSAAQAIAALEPLMPQIRREFGERSETYRQALYVLSAAQARAGRRDEADRTLAEAGALTDAVFPPGSAERLSHLNHLQVLRTAQGRVRDAQAILKQTEPYWNDPKLAQDPLLLVLRRNSIALEIRLSQWEGVEQRSRQLLADMDRLLGPGNDMAAGMRIELARYFTEAGDFDRALAQRAENLALAEAAKVRHPALELRGRAYLVLAQAQAHAVPGDVLRRDAREILRNLQQQRAAVGYMAGDIYIFIIRVALVLDDRELASELMAAAKADPGLNLDRDPVLAVRMAQIEGEVARLQGDLPRSETLLRQRVDYFERNGDKQLMPSWSAALDLAWTLVLMNDPRSEAALVEAAARRPTGVPKGHPLDIVSSYLEARRTGDAAAAAAALADLVKHQRRRPDLAAGPGIGSLAGALN